MPSWLIILIIAAIIILLIWLSVKFDIDFTDVFDDIDFGDFGGSND